MQNDSYLRIRKRREIVSLFMLGLKCHHGDHDLAHDRHEVLHGGAISLAIDAVGEGEPLGRVAIASIDKAALLGGVILHELLEGQVFLSVEKAITISIGFGKILGKFGHSLLLGLFLGHELFGAHVISSVLLSCPVGNVVVPTVSGQGSDVVLEVVGELRCVLGHLDRGDFYV